MRSLRLPSICIVLIISVARCCIASKAISKDGSKETYKASTRDLILSISPDGTVSSFAGRSDAHNYVRPGTPFAEALVNGKLVPSTHAVLRDGLLTLDFGSTEVHAALRLEARSTYIKITVESASGAGLQELSFINVPLTLKGDVGESFTACALALNLQTNVPELPRPNSRLHAICYPKFGFTGAAVALIGCPADRLRTIMQQAVREAPDLPHSAIGGPWALGKAINSGSYLFNFGGMSEKNVDRWIDLAKRMGITQIDFHGGSSFRFGDCKPNPETYPNGVVSFKAVIDRLHKAGIKAGLHTYAFFIDKRCPWVTPVPDKRLAKDVDFTLANDISSTEDGVKVAESTSAMSTITGFFTWNSITLQIDDELITYTGVRKDAPFSFAGCTRGALGTHAAAHRRGATVRHLKECFGLFVPDPETTLFSEVAAHTADMFNQCGFDMIYLDALDGEGILGGSENAWHYGSQFVFEIWKRLQRPALMEMSTFHHHLWYVRSRMGAWDHPTRSHKEFIDIHCKANEECARMFLPGELGWWAVSTWTGAQGEPTYSDDMEYLLSKCIGTGNGLALMGIDPDTIVKTPALPRVADLIRRYEEIRHSGRVPGTVREQLAKPTAEFTLVGDLKAGWKFLPVHSERHHTDAEPGALDSWQFTNLYPKQPLHLRIEALLAASHNKEETTRTVAETADLTPVTSAMGVMAHLAPSGETTPDGKTAASLDVTNASGSVKGSWAQFRKQFEHPIDLRTTQALGIWVQGDGAKEILNVQLRCPSNVVAGIGEHYITVDFKGWRFFELIEPEGRRFADYLWPYGDAYSIYRESIDFAQIGEASLWINSVSPAAGSHLQIGPIVAMALATPALVNPTVTVGARTLLFPGEIPTGGYLEYEGAGTAKIYGRQGELLREVTPTGDGQTTPLTIPTGVGTLGFSAKGQAGLHIRASIMVSVRGEALK